MDSIHRYDSDERRHYTFKKPNPFRLKPHLLYVGEFKKNKEWRETGHEHDFCEIMFLTHGRGYVTVNNVRREIKCGDIIIYNPNVVHFEESCNTEPMSMFFMAFDKLEIANLKKNHLLPPNHDYIYPTDKYYNIFYNLFEEMITEFKEENEFYMEISQNLSRSILMYIFRIINSGEEKPIPILPHNKNIENALKYINKNFRKNITLDDIADSCYINKYYLAHQFAKYQGMSVGKYILNLRINEATRLLRETELSITEISDSVGFYDISYFCRVFKKMVLMTPLNYRKQQKELIEK